MSVIISSTLLLGGLGVAGAGLLYVVAKRFHVAEDPRIEEVEALLPGANCGGCGFNGCHDFATACCKATSLAGMNCPGAGPEAMKKIAAIVGLAAETSKPKIAVLKCWGIPSVRPERAIYDGVASCKLLNSISGGTTGCRFGCLGEGDCVSVCRFGAISMDAETGLPVVNEDACTGCGECVRECPRMLLELRYKGPRGMRVWVACANRDKGAAAMKVCKAACIGCGKCRLACPHDAITVTDNLAYIDFEKCKLCKKCVEVCPTHAIHAVNFPKPKTVTTDENQNNQ